MSSTVSIDTLQHYLSGHKRGFIFTILLAEPKNLKSFYQLLTVLFIGPKSLNSFRSNYLYTYLLDQKTRNQKLLDKNL